MRVFRNPDVLWREEDEARSMAFEALAEGSDVEDVGTSVLFADGVMVSLNLLGTEIWKRCDGRTVEDIISDLITQFAVDQDVLRQDVLLFLGELEQKGFVRYEDD